MKYRMERIFVSDDNSAEIIVSHDDPGEFLVSIHYTGVRITDVPVRLSNEEFVPNFPQLMTEDVKSKVFKAFDWVDSCPFFFTISGMKKGFSSRMEVTASFNTKFYTMKRMMVRYSEIKLRIRHHAMLVGMPYYAVYRYD